MLNAARQPIEAVRSLQVPIKPFNQPDPRPDQPDPPAWFKAVPAHPIPHHRIKPFTISNSQAQAVPVLLAHCGTGVRVLPIDHRGGHNSMGDITQLTYGRWRSVQALRAIYGLFVASQPSLPMLAPRRPPTATHPGWVTSWFV